MSHLIVHLPSTVEAFYFWLGAHWPTAPRHCQWMYGWQNKHYASWSWKLFCRR